MKIQCQSCHKKLQIPDEKLPDSPRFKIKCPKCKDDIAVDRESGEGIVKPEPIPGALEPEIFPPGARVAFFFLQDPVWIKEASEFMQETGYYESSASNLTEAVQKLRLNAYDVLLLEDTEDSERILKEVGRWPGAKRQDLNIILVGSAAPSMDPMAAFNKAVNSYLNIQDRNTAASLLHNALKGFESYYQVFTKARMDADQTQQ